jgi:multidrug resistance efflux pump
VDEARAAVASAQAQLTQAQQLRDRHPIALDLQELAIEAATARLAAARQILARKQELEKQQQLSHRDVAAAEEQIKELTAALTAEQKKLCDLKLQDPAPTVQRLEAEVAVLQARLRQAEQALDEMTLRSPGAGTVLRVLVSPGDVLGTAPKRPAVLFAAAEPHIVRAEVEQEFAGRIAVGQVVQLQEDATARLIGLGTVVRVSDWYLPRRVLVPQPTRFNDTPTLECLIEPAPGTPPLRLGQRVRVIIGASVGPPS